jgi:hypothetical protein
MVFGLKVSEIPPYVGKKLLEHLESIEYNV